MVMPMQPSTRHQQQHQRSYEHHQQSYKPMINDDTSSVSAESALASSTAVTLAPSSGSVSPPLNIAGLPSFSGKLNEDFLLWAYQFIAWCRVHDIEDECETLSQKEEEQHDSAPSRTPGASSNGRRNDLLLLALERDSHAERYLLSLPVHRRPTWRHSLAELQAHFASPTRAEMARQAALNSLYARAFRDEKHSREAVQDLISEFEKSAGQARLDERDSLQMFVWTFRKFSAATSMLKRARSLEEAFHQALRWEKVLVEKTCGMYTTTAFSTEGGTAHFSPDTL